MFNYVSDEDYEVNPYYAPEKMGLEILGSFDWTNEQWQFDYFVLWREKETGNLYYGEDSGCSCPDPFAGRRIEDLHPVYAWSDLDTLFVERMGAEAPEDDDFFNKPENWNRVRGAMSELIQKARAA